MIEEVPPISPVTPSRSSSARSSCHDSTKHKKALQILSPEGLHPVFLTLIYMPPTLYHRRVMTVCYQAGLLTSPPSQRPSHPELVEGQWPSKAKRVPLLDVRRGKGYSGGTAPDFHGIPY
jgi:hypothetical protein